MFVGIFVFIVPLVVNPWLASRGIKINSWRIQPNFCGLMNWKEPLIAGRCTFSLYDLAEKPIEFECCGQVGFKLGAAKIKTYDDAFVLDVVRNKTQIDFDGSVAASALELYNVPAYAIGPLRLKGHGNWENGALVCKGTIKGSLKIGDIFGASFALQATRRCLKINFLVDMSKLGQFVGDALFGVKSGFVNFNISNFTPLSLPEWIAFSVLSRSVELAGAFKPGEAFVGTYCIKTERNGAKNNKKGVWNGNWFFKEKKLFVGGSSGILNFSAEVNCGQYGVGLKNFILRKNGDTKFFVKRAEENTKKIIGFVDCDVIKSCLHRRVAKKIIGDAGRLRFDVDLTSCGEKIEGNIKLCDAMLMSKGGCNPLQKLCGSFALSHVNKKLTCKNVVCDFLHGSIDVPELICEYDENNHFQRVQMPFALNKCLLHYKSDLYAIASGKMHLNKEYGKSAILKGALILDKSKYKGRGLNHGPYPAFLAVDRALKKGDGVKLDVVLKSREAVQIDSLLFEAGLDINFRVKAMFCDDQIHNVCVDGVVNICGGAFQVLENYLDITRGTIKFFPSRPADPIVDVVACARVKKYEIIIHVSGSMHDPYITLSSYPNLPEEQIVSLLLSGAKHSSFSHMLPGLVVSHLGSVMPKERNGMRLGKLAHALTKPFKKLHLLPYFADPDSGQLGAAVDLEVGPGLYASLRKGLKNTDDLSVQMEYLLTDNLSFKVARQAHGDVGGELEMRVKF